MSLFNLLAKPLHALTPSVRPKPKRKRQASQQHQVRLSAEHLEDRVTPADLYWTGPESCAWSDPANWSLGRTPEGGDKLHFGGLLGTTTTSWDDIPDLTVYEIEIAPNFPGVVNLNNVNLTVTTDIT